MQKCSLPHQASAHLASTHKLYNQSKLMTQPAYANEPSPKSPDLKGANQPLETPTPEQTSEQKFELLSVYIDGECSKQEQALVEHWLASDLQIQQQYQQQIKLQLAMKAFFQSE